MMYFLKKYSAYLVFVPTLFVGAYAHGFSSPSFKNVGSPSVTLISTTQTETEATAFVKTMVDNGLNFLSNPKLSKKQKASKFHSLLNQNFDLDAIGKFAVGRYWRKMTAKQQAEYLSVFKSMLVGVYAARFDEYQGQTVELLNTVVLSKKDTLVKSRIITPKGGPEVPVDWRVRHKNGTYKIIDVMVAGVSMSVTQRSDFSSVIQRGGGDVSVLIDHLKN